MAAPARGTDALGETPRPAHDPASEIIFSALPAAPLRPEDILPNRTRNVVGIDVTLSQFPDVGHAETTFVSHDGAELALAVFRRRGDTATGPLFFHIHGGGMVGGTHHDGLVPYLGHLGRHGGAVVSVDYRLAPEHPAPTPVEDCYSALTWTIDRAHAFGVNPDQVILDGGSAGGGLAAGVMLLARDRGGPPLLGVLLECPMLDDRNDSPSIRQFFHGGGGAWSGASNEVGWGALLGAARGTDAISPYDAPARATWLGGLPPVHLSVGSTDPFRDEDVAFASAIWRDGGDCELHVVPGGPHGHDGIAPHTAIARSTAAARAAWVDRLLNPDDPAMALAQRDRILAYFRGTTE